MRLINADALLEKENITQADIISAPTVLETEELLLYLDKIRRSSFSKKVAVKFIQRYIERGIKYD